MSIFDGFKIRYDFRLEILHYEIIDMGFWSGFYQWTVATVYNYMSWKKPLCSFIFSWDFIFTENYSLQQKKKKNSGDSLEHTQSLDHTFTQSYSSLLLLLLLLPFQSSFSKRCDEIYTVESELVPIPTSESVSISRIASSPLRHSSSRRPIWISLFFFFQGTIIHSRENLIFGMMIQKIRLRKICY